MKIGALKKTSLLDYPGKLSAIVGTQGCNMCCPWCHNFFLIPYNFTKRSAIIRTKEVLSFLDQRNSFLDGVVITGGEPTIQADLPEFCENIKEMGLAVKIDTNGTHPAMLNRLLNNDLVDYIAMDIKTDLTQYHQLVRAEFDINELIKSIDIIMSSHKPYEFRTTCVSPYVTRDNIDQIGMLIKGAETFLLQKCNGAKNVSSDSNYEIANENRLIELKQSVESYVSNCEIR